MSNPFDDEFMEDAMGVAALLVVVVLGISLGAMVVISAFNWFEFFRGMIQ
jgi:hypothetical protein